MNYLENVSLLSGRAVGNHDLTNNGLQFTPTSKLFWVEAAAEKNLRYASMMQLLASHA